MYWIGYPFLLLLLFLIVNKLNIKKVFPFCVFYEWGYIGKFIILLILTYLYWKIHLIYNFCFRN